MCTLVIQYNRLNFYHPCWRRFDVAISWWIAVMALAGAVVLSPRNRTRDRVHVAIQAMLLLVIAFAGIAA
jgi:hypothetical protein